MDINVKPGLTKTMGMKVRMEHTAACLGSGMIEVLSTPAMICLMEKTAQNSIQPFLSQGYITLGTEISVKHIKATLVGSYIFCESKLIKVDGKKFFFEIHAWDEKGDIAIATHTRHMVDSGKFMENLENH